MKHGDGLKKKLFIANLFPEEFASHMIMIPLIIKPQVALVVKNPPASEEIQETQFRSLGQEGPLEEEMATHSSILAWIFPWTEEPSGLQSMGRKESDILHRKMSREQMEEKFQHLGCPKNTARYLIFCVGQILNLLFRKQREGQESID